MRKQNVTAIAITGLILASAQSNQAQNTAVDQFDAAQKIRDTQKALEEGQSAPELYPGENSDVGPQELLRRKARKTHFEVMMDSQFFYTSNVNYGESDRTDTTTSVSSAHFALAPRYTLGPGVFAPRIGYRHQWFFYGLGDERSSFEDIDFQAQTPFMDAQYQLNNWVFDIGVEYNRLLDATNHDEFYHDLNTRLGIRRLFPISEGLTFSLGYRGGFRFSHNDVIATPFPLPPSREDANDLNRFDHVFIAMLSYDITEKCVLQPYFRSQVSDFVNQSRNDLLNTIGCSVSYYFTKEFAVRAFASYDLKESDRSSVNEYRKFDGGAGVNVLFKF